MGQPQDRRHVDPLGRQRQLHPRYAALASHYVFDPRFCMPARGKEKPDAESTVKAVQRRFATPVPESLTSMSSTRISASAARPSASESCSRCSGRSRSATASPKNKPLPRRFPARFDACVIRSAAQVDKYQTVAFDGNRYSVPRPFAFQMVTVKGYVDRVVIVAAGQSLRHMRDNCSGHKVLDPIHYLAMLERKPGALDHAPVYRDWKLPACFTAIPRGSASIPWTLAGDRRFVRVLQLLGEHPLDRVQRAVEACQLDHLTSAEAVIDGRSFLRRSRQDRAIAGHRSPIGHGGRGVRASTRPEPIQRLLLRSANQVVSPNEGLPMPYCERSSAAQISRPVLGRFQQAGPIPEITH